MEDQVPIYSSSNLIVELANVSVGPLSSMRFDPMALVKEVGKQKRPPIFKSEETETAFGLHPLKQS